MKNQRPCFPSHTRSFHLSFPFSLVFSVRFFPPYSPELCRRRQKEKKEQGGKREKENGQEGRVREMRDQGAGGAKQRQTALVGGVNQQSRAVGETGSQGKRKGEERGNRHRGSGSDHNAGFWRAVGNKVGLPGSAPEKKVRLEESGGGIFTE